MSRIEPLRINLGAGTDIIPNWLNHDVAGLSGIDCVHDLNIRPWPWDSGCVTEIKACDVLEHLDEFIPAMEEIWRILTPGGTCSISVPYWNSWCAAADPTHRRGFHEITFQFFDPVSPYCRSRPYYSTARFDILEEAFILAPFNPYYSLPGVGEIAVRGRWTKRLVGLIGNYLISNLIQDLRLVLRKSDR
jgi:SAM-dependent methyltransferase